jgi:hypothetical protein
VEEMEVAVDEFVDDLQPCHATDFLCSPPIHLTRVSASRIVVAGPTRTRLSVRRS